MRRALGMLGGSTRTPQAAGTSERRASAYSGSNGHAGAQAPQRRHRFVQDGEVPVTVVRPRNEHASDLSRAVPASPVNRMDVLQESLAAEQLARGAADRALEEAQATIRTLQTRLSHLELAREEALAQVQQVHEQQAQAEAAAAARTKFAVEATHGPVAGAVSKPAVMAAKMSRGKPRKQSRPVVEVEPEPVKWWLSPQALRVTPAKRGRQRTVDTPE